MGKWFQNKSFSTEKQGQGIKARKGHRGIKARKMHRDIKARKMHRAFGVLLAAALVFQTVPFEGIAVSASESSGGGLCEHHRSHTPDCGYKEAEPGHGCTHEHTEECYRTVEGEDGSATKELDCHHEHDESCGYREAAEGSPCTFVCEICNGGTDETPEDNTDDNGINDGESENPGTENEDEIKEPENGQKECICKELCAEGSINTDCPVCGAEGASLSDCKGKDAEDSMEDAEENTDQPEDTGLCKHHREHDDTCGYLPESEDSEGSSCTYECRICPIEKLIAALPDAADITEENADEVRAQLEEILALYRELTGEEQEQIDLSRCYELQEALDAAKALVTADEIPANAVAKIEKEGDKTVYVAADEFADAFANNNNAGATFTLLTDVMRTEYLLISIDCILDLGGHTISGNLGASDYILNIIARKNVTIQGDGGISGTGDTNVLNIGGNVIIKGGTFSCESGDCIFVTGSNASLSITNSEVCVESTGGYGLRIGNASSVQLSAGTYSGTEGAIFINNNSFTLSGLLDQTG